MLLLTNHQEIVRVVIITSCIQMETGNITISSLYEVSCTCGDYDDVSVIIDRLDKSTHFPLVQRDYIFDHLVKLLILEFIGFSDVRSVSTLTVIPYSPLCRKAFQSTLGTCLPYYTSYYFKVDRLSSRNVEMGIAVVTINSSITKQILC